MKSIYSGILTQRPGRPVFPNPARQPAGVQFAGGGVWTANVLNGGGRGKACLVPTSSFNGSFVWPAVSANGIFWHKKWRCRTCPAFGK